MKKLLLLLLLSSNVYADTGIFSYIAPIEREDKTELKQSEIGGYNVYVNDSIHPVSPLLPEALGFTIDLPSGKYTVEMTTFDTDGRESVRSTPVILDVPFKPQAPSSVTVTITISIE